MATTPKAKPVALPMVSVARLEAATSLIDGLVSSEADVFAARGQSYRAAWRERSERDLDHQEIAQVAAAMGAAIGSDDIPTLLSDVSSANLRTRTDPPRSEVLLAAGMATAPAFIWACLRFVALMEIPSDLFEQASESGTLDQELDIHVQALRKLSIADARARASAAFEHLYREAGTTPGEVLGLIAKALGTALGEAVGPLSQFGSLIGSLDPTAGPGGNRSTDSDGAT